jgi:hypothetical protein
MCRLDTDNCLPPLYSRLQGDDIGSGAIENWEPGGIFPEEFFDYLLEPGCLGVITIGHLVALIDLSHSGHNLGVHTSVVVTGKTSLISHGTPFLSA